MAEGGRTSESSPAGPRRRAPVPPPGPSNGSSRELKKRATSDSSATVCSPAGPTPSSFARTQSLRHVTEGAPPPILPRLPPPRLPSTTSSRHNSAQHTGSEEESEGCPPESEENPYANIDDVYNPYEFPPSFDEIAEKVPVESHPNGEDNDSTEDSVYENISTVYRPYEFPPAIPSLVESCLIDDPTPNRTILNDILLSTGEPGTYFVRNSRDVNQKVLAFLSTAGNVKEYRILEAGGKLYLDLEESFDTLEELLNHYTRETLALQKGEHLGRGIHLLVDVETAKLEKESSSYV